MVRKLVRWGIVLGLIAFGSTLLLGSPAWVGSMVMVPTLLFAITEIGFGVAEQNRSAD